jgi:predicted GH43/DUF377 family glycosyl hydrolase
MQTFKLVIAFICFSVFVTAYEPKITVKRLSHLPVIAHVQKQSDFLYNYNSAYVPLDSDDFALAVRVQNLNPNPKSIYDVGPSKIAIAKPIGKSLFNYTYISESNVIIDSDIPEQEAGAEDPRVVLHDKTYYMYYTAVSWTKTHDWHAKLALATCPSDKDITKKSSWTLHGQLFPDQFWSKSGSLLIHNSTHRYLFWNESNIEVAFTKDLLHYEYSGQTFIKVRKTHFDSELVEPGPEPLKMSDGNYLFLYNSARVVSTPHPRPGWNREYNLGFAVLDGKNPMKILYRSENPIFSPMLDWERCDNKSGRWKDIGLMPLVVFVEGWKQVAPDRFLIFYQGCDSNVGVAELNVSF